MIARVDTKFDESTGALNKGQSHRSRCVVSEDVEEKNYARFEGSSNSS